MKQKVFVVIAVTFAVMVYLTWPWRGVPDSDVASTDSAIEAIESRASSRRELAGPSDIQSDSNGEQALSAIQKKTDSQDAEAVRVTGLSKDQLDEALEETRKAFFDPRTSDQYLADLYDALVKTFGEDEAQFRMSLLNEVSNWEAQKEIVAKRRLEVPGEAAVYDQMLLHLGLSNGQISFDEVQSLVRGGAQLSGEHVLTLASNGNIDLVVQLTDAGLLADNTIRNVLSGHNAIASYISGASYFRERLSPEQAADNIEALYQAGVPVDSNNVGVDPLDSAVQGVYDINVESRVAIIERLLRLGATIEDSHREYLEQMRPGEVRDRLQELFADL
ncbi:MAG: hypothetical protein AAF385_05030 [Pseudomonadota bacterium]